MKACEEACFRGIYRVEDVGGNRACRIVRDISYCVRCHQCTTACKLGAITILDVPQKGEGEKVPKS